MNLWIIFVFFLLFVVWFLFNPTTQRIRKIQALINKDRSVCDVINSLDGWTIANIETDALVIIVNPIVMPLYKLYITYKGNRPSNKEIKFLYNKLTSKDSIVTKAHKTNAPVEQLVDNDITVLSIKKAINCAKEIIASEYTYYSKQCSNELVKTLAKPTAIIDRFALIYAVATSMFGKTIHKETYALGLIDNMVKARIILPKNEDYAIFRFDERVNYFIDEIEIEMKCSSFIPSALIYTLRHPSEVPTRDIGKVEPVQALIQWNLILKVISHYFNDDTKLPKNVLKN